MTEISTEIARLLQFGRQRGLLEKADCTYAANRMLVVLRLDGWDNTVHGAGRDTGKSGSHSGKNSGLGL